MKKIKVATYVTPVAALVMLISILLLTGNISGLAQDVVRLMILMGACILTMRMLEKRSRD